MQDESREKEEVKRSGRLSIAGLILGIAALIAVLLVSTRWFVKTSQETTEHAVYDVSEFYLRELTEQKIHQFQNSMDSQLQQLQLTVYTLREEDTASQENLQKHVGELKQKNAFDFYALVDESGMVYTENNVFSGKSHFAFLDNGINGPIVFVDRELESTNLIMAAVPLEGYDLEGRKLIAAVAGLYADTVKQRLLLQNESGQIYCEVIMRDGSYVVSTSHEHLKKGPSLFAALEESAVFMENTSIENMKETIREGKAGISAYYLENIMHYTYYAPIEGTDWFMKITIHYNLISERIDIIRATLTRNSMIQLTGILFILLVAFMIYLSMQRRNKRLQLEKIQAEENNRAKSIFLSNMSHDIRTPMNAIIGFTNLAIKSESDTEKVHGYLTKIQTSSRHLLRLINDVLEMSRIESGKIALEETACSLPEILRDLSTIVFGQIQEKQQELFMDALDITNENVYCDKLRLNQVLLNLLSNAIKFTPSGGKISVHIIQKDKAPKGYGAYEIRVKDTGIGMTPEFASKVFLPFERERTSTVSGVQGTGLGMAITKSIIDRMNGSITVQSAPNQGTEYKVFVNLRLQEKKTELAPITQLKGGRSLIVDGDFDACAAADRMLAKLGMRSECTMSGEEAVLRTKQAEEQKDRFDVYMIDWHLPDLSGMEAARQIRAITGDHAPIIIMTAYDWTNIKEEAREAGVTVFCSKPVFMSDLHAALSQAVGQQKKMSEALEEAAMGMDFTGKKLLLVEDNELNREIAREILTEAGFEVEEAEDGSVAVERLKNASEGDFDLVLTDIQMPIMNGYDTARAIRSMENKAIASIVIVAMTANAFAEDKKAALEAGMDGHIAKPIDVNKLFDTLAEILQKPR